MISRTKIIVLILFLLGIGALGCSGGANLGGLTPGVDNGDLVTSGQMSGTGGELASLEGTAIPLADIYIDDELVGFTDDEGNYQVNVTAGEHTIAFGYDGIIFHESIVDSASRQVTRFPRPPAVGKVGGKVFGIPYDGDPETNDFKPLEGAIVLCIDQDRRWVSADVTDEEGKYLIKNAPAGPSILVAFHRGYQPWSQPMFINPNMLQLKNIHLKKAPFWGHILSLVRDENFDPIPGALVVLKDPEDPEFVRQTETTDFGAFLLNRIKPGEYVLNVHKEGYESVQRPILVERGRNFVRIKMIKEGDGGPG